jgi:poly(A) polymerase
MKPVGRIDLPERMRDLPTRALLDALSRGSVGARFVGGCVRDTVAGRPVGDIDIDIAVDRPPEDVVRALAAAQIKTVPTGIAHGTVTAIVDRRPYELTTLRRDVETDGRRAVVAFTDDWLEDASRRDFTFNALYADADGALYDPFDGLGDLAVGRVRFIGDPDRRIAEDRLRVLRFFRFHAWYGNPPFDEAGFAACRRNAGTLGALSAERVAKELLKLLAAPSPAGAVDAMIETGVLDRWLPELAGTARLRKLAEREDLPDPVRRLAAILPESADATAIGKRLKLSTQQALRLSVMLARDPVLDIAGGPRAWRADIYRLGTNLYVDRLLLATEAAGDWRAALRFARSWTPPELPVSGGDALKLGVASGPRVGALIEEVERWWVGRDFVDGRAACLAELERIARS